MSDSRRLKIDSPGTRRPLRLAGLLVMAFALVPCASHGGTSGQTNLFTPAGDGRAASLGDFISATAGNGGIATLYRYFIEVPPSPTRVRVQLFDADVLRGTNESPNGRDKDDGGATITTVVYTLLRPAGTTAATLTCDNNTGAGGNPCAGADNAWFSLLDSNLAADRVAGHWELDVDMRSGTGDDINAVGIRADDGDETSGGVEYNVYYDSHANLGVNSDATTNTRTYVFYPYVTSGCTFSENDFDYDVGGGTGNGPGATFGQVDLTSRSGAITRQVTSANLSANNVWKRNVLARWGTDTAATDYGLWTLNQRISNFTAGGNNSNNYANVYFANDQIVAGNPTANPTTNAFRVYFPTDGGAKPAKPYIEQFLTCFPSLNCLTPPPVNVTRTYRVTVRLVNPSGAGSGSITFSNTNLVRTNVPGGQVTYGGSGTVLLSQGSIVAQPGVGGSGPVTWNPGVVTAGTTAVLSYVVNIRPTAAGRVVATGTPAANGTQATFVDNTGNTTQARATFSTGGLCELAIDTTVITPAVVSELTTRQAPEGHQGTVVEWSTVSEVGTVGFDLLRFDRATRTYAKVNERPLPSLLTAPQGGRYRFLDPTASGQGVVRYKLVEHLASGGTREHGPFRALVAARPPLGDRDKAGASGSVAGAAAEEPFSRVAWTPKPAEVDAVDAGTPASRKALRQAGPASAVKVGVGDTGLYRISAAKLAEVFGLTPAQAQTLVSQRALRLANRGREVPWFADADGLLFYGRAVDSLYARDNVYWLTQGGAASNSDANGGNPAAPAPPARFAAAAHLEQDLFAAPAAVTDPESDYWFWDFVIGADAALGRKTFNVDAPGLDAGTPRLTVNLQGATKTGVAGEHHAVVRVNGSDVGAMQWTGAVPASGAFDLPPGLLHESGNTVEIEGLLDPGVPSNIFYVDGFDLSYPRRFQAVADGLTFRASSAAPVTVSGYSSPAVTVLDVTQPDRPRRVTGTLVTHGVADSNVTFVPAAGAQYLVAGPLAIREPRWLRADNPSQLRSASAGADYLVITTAALAAPAADLASLRTGQGLVSKVVDVEDVMDEFNDGIQSPYALRDFLAYASKMWSPKPRYVVLAGAGSYDYRDLLGLGGNLVPPILAGVSGGGLFASDPSLMTQKLDKADDDKPKFAVGRIPVTTAAALQAYVDKLRAYESGPPAPWAGKAVLLADADAGSDFAPDAERVAGFFPSSFDPDRIYLSQLSLAGARGQLFSDLAAGVGIVNFVGHGGLDRLSSQGLLTSADVAALGNGSRAPLLTAFTCIINRFDVPGFAPLGAVLATAGNGGATAVYAPTGLNDNGEGRALGEIFYQELGRGGDDRRLGDVMRRAISSYLKSGGSADQIKVYTLLGDPAMQLQKGAATPSSGPGVVPGVPNG
jgi:hypothetical protein